MSRYLVINIYFGELFAPTVAGSSVRLLTAAACQLDLDLGHFDIQAFVQSDPEKNVYNMRVPPGCGRLTGNIVRLNKSLYGLKPGSRQWHTHITKYLQTLRCVQCLADAYVFRLMEEGSVVMTYCSA